MTDDEDGFLHEGESKLIDEISTGPKD